MMSCSKVVCCGVVGDWLAQFVALVAQADATTPTAQAPPGKKGRAKQSAARNRLPRLISDQEAVLASLHRLVVPFDNNQEERDVRMVPCPVESASLFGPEPPQKSLPPSGLRTRIPRRFR